MQHQHAEENADAGHWISCNWCWELLFSWGEVDRMIVTSVRALLQLYHSHLYTPGADSELMKLFSRSRSTSFSIRTCAGSRSLGSLAGRMVSDWKNAARSLREEAAASRAAGSTLLSRDEQDKNTREWLVAHKQDNRRSGSRTSVAFSIPINFVCRIWAGAAVKIKPKSWLKTRTKTKECWNHLELLEK